MTDRRLSWKLLLATAAPILFAHALVLLVVLLNWPQPPGESSAAPQQERSAKFAIAVVSLIVALSTIAVVLVLQLRRWGRLLMRIAQAARSISSGDLHARIEASGSRELELLGRAIDQMRKRLVGQVEQMDRQRRTFETLLTELREGVVVIDHRGRVVLLNPAAIRLLNLFGRRNAGDYVGLAVERCIPQLDLQRLLTQSASAIAHANDGNREPAHERDETRLEIESASGLRYLQAQATAIALPVDASLADSNAEGRLLVLTDITELTRSVQMKSDFVANASHELRTPLSSIRAAVETLQNLDWERESESARRYVGMIERHSARLEALAGDLLDLSRIEGGAARLKPECIDIETLSAEIREHFADRIASRGLHFDVDRSACARGEFIAIPQLVRLVIDNLIDNAIKFSERGKRIRLEWTRQPETVTFAVADEGCGIPPEEQVRVFERFYQVERARSGSNIERGTGLGLSIVRHAVSTLRGEVSLRSTIGVGTRIQVTIPQET